VTSPPDPGLAPLHPFDSQVMASLRALMRATVTRGAGTAANIAGSAVYGQVGNTSLGKTGKAGKNLRAAWFVGYQGKIAFAVIELTKSSDTSAATLAGTFLRGVNG
jgi:membrane peptidoglycan carboxypeptidase